jgi:hypothetical protein
MLRIPLKITFYAMFNTKVNLMDPKTNAASKIFSVAAKSSFGQSRQW